MARTPTHPPLKVYLNGRLVGRLRRESSGAIDFTYDPTWLAWNNAIPVSLSMPLREDRYLGDPVVAVFDNLLPDSDQIRRQLAERTHAGGFDAYSLLAAIGPARERCHSRNRRQRKKQHRLRRQCSSAWFSGGHRRFGFERREAQD